MVSAAAVIVGLALWLTAGTAAAHPGNTCNPAPGHGYAGCHVDIATITALAPKSGPTSGGTSVTITGTSLNATQGVKFGGVAAKSFVVNSDTSLTAVSPAHLSGTVDVTITNKAGTSATAGTLNDYKYTLARYQETSSLLSYTVPWTSQSSLSYSGGTQRYRSSAGSVNIKFSGVAIKVIATKGPIYGKVKVTVDGVVQPTNPDLFNATYLYKQPVFTMAWATSAVHIVKLEYTLAVTGAAAINLDAVDIDGVLVQASTRYEETSSLLAYSGPWTSESLAGFSGGKQRYLASAGSVTAKFTGTGIKVIATRGPIYGKLKVTVDGTVQPTNPDLYNSTFLYKQVVFTKTGLSNGTHTLKLEYSGLKDPAVSGAAVIDLDALDVNGTLIQAP